MEEILNLALKQCEAAEVFSYSDEEIPVEFESNRLKNIESNQSTVIALRIIKDGRVGYGVTTNSEEPEKLVTMAVETAEFGMKARFELPSPQLTLSIAIICCPYTRQLTRRIFQILLSLKTGHASDSLLMSCSCSSSVY
jgi:predicted Zn-dependent protease